jgi:serine/threonine-protein kinase
MNRTRNCPAASLDALLEGSLSAAEEEGLARHLDSCPRCRRDLAGRPVRLPGGVVPSPAVLLAQEPALERAILELKTDLHKPPPTAGLAELLAEPWHSGRIGPYQVREVLGRGGMGVVLHAFDPILGRPVAIKALAPHLAAMPAARRRFAREAQLIAAVRHDHIVAIHAVMEADGLPCLVMEYVAGVSLQQRLDEAGPVATDEILRIGAEVARGLEAAHRQGLIHRDVKPANILLEEGSGKVKITDFGLARAVDDASLTSSGVINGTPLYMAPEQARDERLDARADLFSLGSVLYTMCTGEPAFRAKSTPAVLRRICEEEPRPIRELNPAIPEWLEAFISGLHAKDPALRLGDAREAAEMLEQYREHRRRPSLAVAPVLPQRPKSLGRRGRFPASGALLLAMLLGAATLGAFRLEPRWLPQPACADRQTTGTPSKGPGSKHAVFEITLGSKGTPAAAGTPLPRLHFVLTPTHGNGWSVAIVGRDAAKAQSACDKGGHTVVLTGGCVFAGPAGLPLGWIMALPPQGADASSPLSTATEIPGEACAAHAQGAKAISLVLNGRGDAILTIVLPQAALHKPEEIKGCPDGTGGMVSLSIHPALASWLWQWLS